MTSKTIYTNQELKIFRNEDAILTPTYLYVKQHSITKKKYFGKTIQDPIKYLGSGKYWKSHIKKHGPEHVINLWVSEPFTDKNLIQEFALMVSEEYDIVKSEDWLNLNPENGLGCGPITQKSKEKQLLSKNSRTPEQKAATKLKRKSTEDRKSTEEKQAQQEKTRATKNARTSEEKQASIDKMKATKATRTPEQKQATKEKKLATENAKSLEEMKLIQEKRFATKAKNNNIKSLQ